MNFLEQLAAEWYEYKGYFVRTNVKFNKRDAGGYEGEIDVLAYRPETKTLVHVETSMDADSWPERKRRFQRKFDDAARSYPKLFKFEVEHVQQVAVGGWGQKVPAEAVIDGVKMKTLSQFMTEVVNGLKEHDPRSDIVPETMPLLRAIQVATHWGAGSKQDGKSGDSEVDSSLQS